VTTYFNPCRYVTKRRNFDLFVEGLAATTGNLLVVELALGGDAFELAESEHHVRVRANAVMWQREVLVNLACARLPPSATKVAWLDCDLLFEDGEWLERTSAALDRYAVVQPFSHCLLLDPGVRAPAPPAEEDGQVWESAAAVFSRDPSLLRGERFHAHGHTGFAWAARRELFDACGLYEGCLTGSADHLMAHAFSGTSSSGCVAKTLGTGAHAAHFARWAAEADGVVGGRLGHVPGRVLHLWHGAWADRRYDQNNQEFRTFDFDPVRHLRRDEQGLWEWADAPGALRAWAMEWFASRREDGAPLGAGRHGG
jgi:hypothetical protein